MTRRRTRIAEGVYTDQYGLSAVVKCGGVQREKRFPPDTPLDELKSWRIQTRAELDDARDERMPAATRGTLTADILRFLKTKQHLSSYLSNRCHLTAWCARFGDRRRRSLKRDELDQQIQAWQVEGFAPNTIRQRCFLLRACWRFCDGRRARCPVDDVQIPRMPAPRPVAVPITTIQKVARRLKAAGLEQDFARFLVRATTGQRPSQIMRTEPGDLDWKRKLWNVRPAKGGNAIPIPLNPDMLAAWKAFAAAKAWGRFDTTTAAQVLRAHGWPVDVRPYDMRHTFAIDLLLAGVGLDDVQGLLGHRSISTTRKFYGPVLVARLRTATAKRRLKLPA